MNPRARSALDLQGREAVAYGPRAGPVAIISWSPRGGSPRGLIESARLESRRGDRAHRWSHVYRKKGYHIGPPTPAAEKEAGRLGGMQPQGVLDERLVGELVPVYRTPQRIRPAFSFSLAL